MVLVLVLVLDMIGLSGARHDLGRLPVQHNLRLLEVSARICGFLEFFSSNHKIVINTSLRLSYVKEAKRNLHKGKKEVGGVEKKGRGGGETRLHQKIKK